jgi:geranylgeranyl diphosphate synthase, type II
MPDKIDTTQTEKSQYKVPPSGELRHRLAQYARDYKSQHSLTPPLSLKELESHCGRLCREKEINPDYKDYLAVLINNEVWRESLAQIPYEKRLVLLPKCLRSSENCKAEFSETGLECRDCGSCVISEIKSYAENLGCMVLVAEGSPIVLSLIQSGCIEALIGVSCLDVLEKTFPYLEAGSIPAMAIPLLFDGCRNTQVDVETVLEAIEAKPGDSAISLNMPAMRDKVIRIFEPSSLRGILNTGGHTEELALQWMACEGKRWRPQLTVYTHNALAAKPSERISPNLAKTAVAVECFHKASLIHDDIEDDDQLRYGRKTMHAEHGIPIALNVGDYLVGQGYALLAGLDIEPELKSRMLAAASSGHVSLCCGQGRELKWAASPGPISVEEVLRIFKGKTAPAFEVAVKLGIISAGAGREYDEVVEKYSQALGLAYQIKDDIEDFDEGIGIDELAGKRPSILLALAWECGGENDRRFLSRIWTQELAIEEKRTIFMQTCESLNIRSRAADILEEYKSAAAAAINPLENAPLKILLRRIIGKIFNEIDILGCCDEHKKSDT